VEDGGAGHRTIMAWAGKPALVYPLGSTATVTSGVMPANTRTATL
jgi:hypothetical protein